MSSVTPLEPNDGPQPQLVISAHEDFICALAYLPDGRRVVTGSEDGTVRVWNLEDGMQEGTSMQHRDKVFHLAVTRDGEQVISGDVEGNIKVRDVESHQLVKEWTHPDEWPRIVISPDDRLLVVGCQTAFIYAMEGGWQIIQCIEVDGGIRCASFSPDSSKLACATFNHDICVYDVSDGTLVLGPLIGHQDYVQSVLWSGDGSRLFSGSWDKTIRCWNLYTGEPIGEPWTGHTAWILALSLSADGSILASASGDQTVRFWNASTGDPVGQPLRHDEPVDAVSFSPRGRLVASAGWDGKICVWRIPRLDTVESQVTILIICPAALLLTTFVCTPGCPQPPAFHSTSPHPTTSTLLHAHPQR